MPVDPPPRASPEVRYRPTPTPARPERIPVPSSSSCLPSQPVGTAWTDSRPRWRPRIAPERSAYGHSLPFSFPEAGGGKLQLPSDGRLRNTSIAGSPGHGLPSTIGQARADVRDDRFLSRGRRADGGADRAAGPGDSLVRLSIILGVASTLAYLGLVGPRSAVAVAGAVGVISLTATLIQLDLAARACPPEAAGSVFALLMALENLAAAASTALGGWCFERGSGLWGPAASFRALGPGRGLDHRRELAAPAAAPPDRGRGRGPATNRRGDTPELNINFIKSSPQSNWPSLYWKLLGLHVDGRSHVATIAFSYF